MEYDKFADSLYKDDNLIGLGVLVLILAGILFVAWTIFSLFGWVTPL